MQNFAEPLFSKGRVLKKESLEALRDFPGRLAKLGLADWRDGILYGFGISYERGMIEVCAGAVWYQGQVVLTETQRIPFRAYEQQITVCLRLHPVAATEDFSIRPLELRLKNGEPGSGELELGRFRLSEGARLRKDYKDLRDCRTAYNTLDITQIPYAGAGGITVSPELLRIFARLVLEHTDALELDVQFAFLCLNHPPVSRECLLRYLSRRMGEPYRELTHSEIYERLVRIAEAGNRGMQHNKRREGPAVF
ncbi:MAG: hypothetical protein K2N87_12395 [Eubacterium sp.]|nr:hypothetical protein [Eubacterium sp.]